MDHSGAGVICLLAVMLASVRLSCIRESGSRKGGGLVAAE